ncbi:glycosyltransferase family 2 protein [Actinomycetospora sp. TBRC 11914]|uniref:glycosyltransferase family 2 protein n=1 Tax=Actinomycetospora sp. TBRC 11914 TaxID=2729387 RepID=UPI00145EF44A|nr:glycosyltransferase family 2 protein [Actinomycetospora sp. TBRC 11914]NMO90354.1 glycosyltransferase family 2 protein [Actinomycetospora sp. TBRC 11914]
MTALVPASVIVCAHTNRRRGDIEDALASLARQTCPPLEVVLVVDHNESLLAWARDRFAGEARVVASTWPAGLSGARNTGVGEAVGDVLAFLDDDAVADPTWLERLVGHYAEPDVVGVGGGAFPVWEDQRPTWFPPEFFWVVGCSYVGLPGETATVRNFIGANMSYRREAFEQAGVFTLGLGRVGSTALGCEETEFGIRVRAALPGARFVYDPSAAVRHSVGVERGRVTYFLRRCYAEGVSKAAVSAIAGPDAALESERRYVGTVLPRGVAAGLLGRGSNPLRAAGIVAGLAVTAAGYAMARVRGTWDPGGPAPLAIRPAGEGT